MRAHGGELIVVGSGTAEQAKRFAKDENVEVMVTDPTLEAYRIAGMKRGLRTVINPKSALNAVRALRDGHRQGRTRGDPWQQGGVVVVSALDDGGKLLLQHAASEAGDPTDFGAVARVLELAHPA